MEIACVYNLPPHPQKKNKNKKKQRITIIRKPVRESVLGSLNKQ